MSGPAFTRIVTHDDLDGLVSAALASLATGVDRFFFTGPVAVQNGEVAGDEGDIVCDLPLPVRFGMWFDHHPGNLEDARLRGVDPAAVPGRFAPERSCARVVFTHFAGHPAFPPFLEDTVARTDRVDSFDYPTLEDWRRPEPERFLADSLRIPGGDFREERAFLERALRLLREKPLAEVIQDPQAASRIAAFQALEAKSLELMRADASFRPDDPGREVLVADLTRHNRKPEVVRQAAFLLFPEALAVLLVSPVFRQGKKTTDLSFSMSLSYRLSGRAHGKDVGEIMRALNIGDGHAGAGAGRIACAGKDQMLKAKERTIGEILRRWRLMKAPGGLP